MDEFKPDIKYYSFPFDFYKRGKKWDKVTLDILDFRQIVKRNFKHLYIHENNSPNGSYILYTIPVMESHDTIKRIVDAWASEYGHLGVYEYGEFSNMLKQKYPVK